MTKLERMPEIGNAGNAFAWGGLIDLVVVPTSRPFGKTSRAMELAVHLARSFGAAVLVLCSKMARPTDFPGWLADGSVPIALTELLPEHTRSGLLPRFKTSSHVFASRQWTWTRDVAVKRNLAVLFAMAQGRRRVLFLDDDVRRPEDATLPDHQRFGEVSVANAFRQMGDTWSVAGWTMTEFPDNSVVCHARRLLGLRQSSFPGGGALAVEVTPSAPFFPSVYNEDWLFMYPYLEGKVEGAVGGVGNAGDIGQAPYSPFARGRSASEEFGDTLAEGLFNALGARCRSNAVWDRDYWRQVVDHRRRMIRQLIHRIDDGTSMSLSAAYRGQIRDALQASLDRQTHGDSFDGGLPKQIRDFMVRWHGDLAVWRSRLAKANLSTAAAILRKESTVLHGCPSLGQFLPERIN